MVHLSFALSITETYCLRFFVGNTERTECTGSVHTCEDDTLTASAWAAHVTNFKKNVYQNRTETSLHKKILADVGMAQCINALANKVHKQEMNMPCTQ